MIQKSIFFLILTAISLSLWAQGEDSTTVVSSAPTPVSLESPSYKRKPYQVSVYLREEYDDNINTTQFDPITSFKSIAEPEIALNFPDTRSFLGLRYRNSTTYYDHRPGNQFDYGHYFDLTANHEFTSRFSVDVTDHFEYSQQPELAQDTGSIFRRLGNYYQNSGHAGASFYFTPRIFLNGSFGSDLWRYDDQLQSDDLDRNVWTMGTGINYIVSPVTLASLNYEYIMTRFITSPRDADSHIGYLGVMQTMMPQWSINAQAGGEYRKAEGTKADISPFASISTNYNFLPSSVVSVGYNVSLQDTDVTNYNFSQSQHIFTKVTAQLTYHLQVETGADYIINDYPSAQGLGFNIPEATETTLVYHIGLSYTFTPQLVGEVAWSYSKVDSDFFGRSYNRNLASVGVRFVY